MVVVSADVRSEHVVHRAGQTRPAAPALGVRAVEFDALVGRGHAVAVLLGPDVFAGQVQVDFVRDVPDVADAAVRAAAGLLVCAAGVFFAAYRRRKRKVEGARISPEAAAPSAQEGEEGSGGLFTAREKEILNLLRQGLSNREIAENLDIQEVTVRFHLRNLYQKTGFSTRSELAALALSASDTDNGKVKSE